MPTGQTEQERGPAITAHWLRDPLMVRSLRGQSLVDSLLQVRLSLTSLTMPGPFPHHLAQEQLKQADAF